jgi:hypothetical protein
MPARNSIEKVVSDLTERAKPFNLTVVKVEHYQNVRKSKISLMDANNNTLSKSLEKWREFFSTIEVTEPNPSDFYFNKIKTPPLEEKVLNKAETLNHTITNLIIPNYNNARCTVHCNTHNQTFENVSAAYYALPRNKYGVFCCSSAVREKRIKPSAKKQT